MPLYENRKDTENRIQVDLKWCDGVVFGPTQVMESIVQAILAEIALEKHPITLAFEGWYGVDWPAITTELAKTAAAHELELKLSPVKDLFKPIKEIDAYKQTYITDDPGFGLVNTQGHIRDLMVPGRIDALHKSLDQVHKDKSSKPYALLVFGPGSHIPELSAAYDLTFYFDKTRQPILWEMWDGKMVPFGRDTPKKDYYWKEYYYCDYYLLDRQKEFTLERMDYWVEGIAFKSLKLIPHRDYNGIMSTLVQYPIKEVPIFQPGPWGAYRYKDLFEVPGLECNAWNELAGPELSILVDIGCEELINMPMTNLMQYPDKFLGSYLSRNYPHLFPMDVWLDDGYFPKPTPAERISMPIHNHPSSDYVKAHFNEPIGRYETYYIAEAYEGANTWLGYKDDADLEEWEQLCRESNNLKAILNWKDFINNVETNVGDLILIPPGTTHGHGGNQMVLEMDTCPSIAATEYSFFLYDFARHSWDDNTKTMTARPVKMHLDHGFDTEKWVRESWVKDHLLAKPRIVRWTRDYGMDRYTSDPRMPFEIERFHFEHRAENDTEGQFLHIVTLTVGHQVTIRSMKNPAHQNTIKKFQSALVPACFGEYEFINEDGGACTVVQLRWKKG
jgi:hypothetical protein